MKALLCAVAFLLLANYSWAQHVYQIRADTVRIYNTCDTAELVLENRTKGTLGFLYNKGDGRTEFRKLQLSRIGSSGLAISGQDTIDMNFDAFGDSRYDLLSTNFVVVPNTSYSIGQWPLRKVVGYYAYNNPDMPSLSNQAMPGKAGSKMYYDGLVVRHDNTAFDLAVNWDGELRGPNGVFVRSRDDTQPGWSNWRELLFKDYADTTYALKAGAGSYIQNQLTAAQTGNFWISGEARSATVATPVVYTNNSAGQLNLFGGATTSNSARGGEIVLLGGAYPTKPGEILFRTGTGGGGAQQPERMRITANGNVGIGTSSPNANLSLHIVQATGGQAVLAQSTAAIGALSGAFYGVASTGVPTAANQRIGGLYFSSYSGATSLPAAQLDVFSDGAWTAGSSHPSYMRFSTVSAGSGALSEKMRIAANGNVGIGTTAPANTLHVVGTARVTGVAEFGNTSFIRGDGAGAATSGYIRFMENDGTTRKGYVGDASTGNSDMYLTSDAGGVRLVPLNGTSGNLNVQGTSMDYNGGQLLLNKSGANLISFNAVSLGAPTFNTRSVGTKISLWNAAPTATTTGWDIGMESSHMWFGIAQSVATNGFKWYAGTTQIARLDGIGSLTLNGQVQATSFFQSSLRSLKKDIKPFDQSALAILEKVQVRTFKFKADPTGKTNIGFIADEVPDQMATPKRNGVDQASTVALLVKAVQELTTQNKALQQQVNALEEQLKSKEVQH
jgi:hypothetical protein